jgi:hypothetical protein
MREKRKRFYLFLKVFCTLFVLLFLALQLEKFLSQKLKFSKFVTILIISSVVKVILVLIYFNKSSQCILMLLVPQIVTKKGRVFIVGCAFYLAFAGPAKNLIHNSEVMTESVLCTQVSLNKMTK